MLFGLILKVNIYAWVIIVKKTHKDIPFFLCKWKVGEGLTSEKLT